MSNYPAPEFDSAESLVAFDARSAVPARHARNAMSWLRRALPQTCVLCAASSRDRLLCAACEYSLPRMRASCPICALPSQDGGRCGACLAKRPPFDLTICAWPYAFPVDRLLHAFKYGGRLALVEPLVQGLACAIAQRNRQRVDAIVPLPLSAARQHVRGFNQAHEIARRLAQAHGAPMREALVRIRDGPPQATLAWRERVRNLRGAFVANGRFDGQRIAIVDDVMTTGATLHAAANAMRKAAAAAVELWVVARTLPSGQDAM